MWGYFGILWIYVTNPENQHMNSLGTQFGGVPVCILQTHYSQFSSAHVLLKRFCYTTDILKSFLFLCLLKSELRYPLSCYNKWDSWRIRIMVLCFFLCLMLKGMEANYQTRTRTGIFPHLFYMDPLMEASTVGRAAGRAIFWADDSQESDYIQTKL